MEELFFKTESIPILIGIDIVALIVLIVVTNLFYRSDEDPRRAHKSILSFLIFSPLMGWIAMGELSLVLYLDAFPFLTLGWILGGFLGRLIRGRKKKD